MSRREEIINILGFVNWLIIFEEQEIRVLVCIWNYVTDEVTVISIYLVVQRCSLPGDNFVSNGSTSRRTLRLITVIRTGSLRLEIFNSRRKGQDSI